jgi:hypothetical protein
VSITVTPYFSIEGIVPVSADHTVPGTTDHWEVSIPVRRTFPALYRAGIVAVDKVGVPAGNSLANNAGDTAGALLAATTYNLAVGAGNQYGPTTASTVVPVTTPSDGVNTHTLRATIPGVVNADYYSLFLSTGAAPLWVGRITAAQLLAGGYAVTAVGTLTFVGTAPSGSVDIRVPGTGLASNVAPFLVNNAHRPESVPSINAMGTANVFLMGRVSVADLRILPAVSLMVWGKNDVDPTVWHPIANIAPALGSAVRSPLTFATQVSSFGFPYWAVTVEALTGQGASLDLWTALL